MVKIFRARCWSFLSMTSQVDDRGPHPSLRVIVHVPSLSVWPGWAEKYPRGESSCSSGKREMVVKSSV